MLSYNRNFQLSINDVDMIEEALRAHGRELCRMRRALSDDNPTDMESIRVVEEDQRRGERRANEGRAKGERRGKRGEEGYG